MRFVIYFLIIMPSLILSYIEANLLDYNIIFNYINAIISFQYDDPHSYFTIVLYYYPIPLIFIGEYLFRMRRKDDESRTFE
jgi:hypothetical protein